VPPPLQAGGQGFRVPLAPLLPRNRRSAVIFLAFELIFTRRFSAAVPVACPIGFRPPSRVPGVASVSAPRPPGHRARRRSPVAARRSNADRSAPRACCCGPSAPSARAGSPPQSQWCRHSISTRSRSSTSAITAARCSRTTSCQYRPPSGSSTSTCPNHTYGSTWIVRSPNVRHPRCPSPIAPVTATTPTPPATATPRAAGATKLLRTPLSHARSLRACLVPQQPTFALL
jgi:hypothetical protein